MKIVLRLGLVCAVLLMGFQSLAKEALIPVRVHAHAGDAVFRAEVARTPPQQQQGLMFRASVPEGEGMLFPLPAPRRIAFWMKNTLVPLDMLFIGPDRRIATLKENATPLSEEGIPSRVPVIAVLEIAGGAAKRAGIAVGDRVEWEDRR